MKKIITCTFVFLLLFIMLLFIVGCDEIVKVSPEDAQVNIDSNSEKSFEIKSATTYVNESVQDDENTEEIEPEPEPIITKGIYSSNRIISIGKNENASLEIKPIPEGGDLNLSFLSSDDGVATVDENGNVFGIKEGYCSVEIRDEISSSIIKVGILVNSKKGEPYKDNGSSRFVFNPETGVYENKDSINNERANICLVGDLMCLSSQQSAARVKGEGYDFSKSFSIVSPILKGSDLSIGNMETILTATKPYASSLKNFESGNPNCNGPSSYLAGLRSAGFDALITANNHCGDAKYIGIIDTLYQIERYGFPSTGTNPFEDNTPYIIFDVNGIKIGVVAFTNHVNGSSVKSFPNNSVQFYSRERAEDIINRVKEAGAEFTIAYMHWGVEHTNKNNSSQTKEAQYLSELGVDLIAGSHSHCVQPTEYITNSKGKQTLVLYSMGNFVSSMSSRSINSETMIVSVDLEKKDNTISIVKAGFIPCKVGTFNGKPYTVMPTNPKYNNGVESKTLKNAEEHITKVVSGALSLID